MAELRKAYGVDINHAGKQIVTVYDCVITPKRVAVYKEGETRYASYFEPQHWPQHWAAWTVEEAWAKFLEGKRRELESARESVTWLEEQVAVAEAASGALTNA